MDGRLSDSEWLAEQYRARTLASIASELGCSPATVRSRLVAAGVGIGTAASAAAERRRDELNDPAWLAARYKDASAADLAAELEVRHRGLPNLSRVVRPWAPGAR